MSEHRKTAEGVFSGPWGQSVLPTSQTIEDEIAACAELLRGLIQDICRRHESAFGLVPDEHMPFMSWFADMEAGVGRLDLMRQEHAAQATSQQRAEADQLTRIWMDRFALEPHAHFVCPVCKVRPR